MVHDVMGQLVLLDVSQGILRLETGVPNVAGVEDLVGIGKENWDHVRLVTLLSQLQTIQT